MNLPYSYCGMRTTPGTVIRGMKCKCGGRAQDARGNR